MTRRANKKQKLAKRLTRWLTYNTIFALLPLGVSILLHSLAGKLSLQTFSNSPEVLFFALTISATAMGDISETITPIGWDLTFTILSSALLLGAVTSAILYGGLVYDTTLVINSPSGFREKLLSFSIGLALIMFILGTLAEVLIGKIEGK
ncbi:MULTISPECIES: hypothetical protein [unclassified Microcoleus]|jgi:hypothetical protein|uniref:hypothetical protein n=1 Tax=unclassified Microcoleus TaxID=2642155 RepID=UPI002FCEF7E8